MAITVDLNKLRYLENTPSWWIPEIPLMDVRGCILQETHTRARAALYHCKQGFKNLEECSFNIRAALMEFVSMEETSERDMSELGLDEKVFKIHSTQDPLLIILKELRNFDIHIGTSTAAEHCRDFICATDPDSDDAFNVNTTVRYIDNIDWKRFSDLRNIKNANNKNNVRISLEHFDAEQREWGITAMIYRGILVYLDHLKTL